jgi:hypothetical protein
MYIIWRNKRFDKIISFVLCSQLKRGIACRPPVKVAKKHCTFCNMQNAYNPTPCYDVPMGTESQPSEGRQREINIQRLTFKKDETYKFYVTH